MRITCLSRTRENITLMTGLNSLPGIWRLARIEMKGWSVILILTGLLVVGVGIGLILGSFLFGGVTQDTGADIDYLIAQMEVARETHQSIVDNPERWSNWFRAGIDHRIWVETYEDILEILRDLK